MKTKKPKTPRVIVPLPKEKDFSHLKEKRFSKKQLHALSLVAKGYTNVQIGDSMGISDRGVEKRLERLHGKLESQSNIMAYRKALLLGLLIIE